MMMKISFTVSLFTSYKLHTCSQRPGDYVTFYNKNTELQINC